MEYTANYKKILKKEIKIFRNAFNLSNALAEELFLKSKEYSRNKKNFNIALSGGNTPITFFQILHLKYAQKINWRNIQFYWSDERCVPPDDAESNFGRAKIFLFDKIKIPDGNIHRIKGEEAPYGEASRYSDELLSNLPLINNLPSLDLILLGLGEDGHTASIFPGQNYILNSLKICTVSVHPETGQRRITLTRKIINNAKQIAFIATGNEKARIVHKILQRKKDYRKFPASHIEPVNGKLEWLLDVNSSSILEYKNLNTI
jgi:6-phosphogluconolactonase